MQVACFGFNIKKDIHIMHIQNLGILGNSGISGELSAIPAVAVSCGFDTCFAVKHFLYFRQFRYLPKCLLELPKFPKIPRSWIMLKKRLIKEV